MFVKRQPNLWGIFAAGVEGIGESVGTAVIVRSARPKKGGSGAGLEGCTPCAAAAQADAIQAAARRALPRRKVGKW